MHNSCYYTFILSETNSTSTLLQLPRLLSCEDNFLKYIEFDFHVWFNTRIGTQVRVFLNTVWRKRKVSQFENLKFSGIFFSDCQILFEKCLLIMSWRLIIFYSYTLNLLDYFLLVRWIFATISKTFSLYEKIALLRDFHEYKGVIKNSAQEKRQQRQNNFQKVSRSEPVHWLVESF